MVSGSIKRQHWSFLLIHALLPWCWTKSAIKNVLYLPLLMVWSHMLSPDVPLFLATLSRHALLHFTRWLKSVIEGHLDALQRLMCAGPFDIVPLNFISWCVLALRSQNPDGVPKLSKILADSFMSSRRTVGTSWTWWAFWGWWAKHTWDVDF